MNHNYPDFKYREILLSYRSGTTDMFSFAKGYRDVYTALYTDKYQQDPTDAHVRQGIQSQLKQTTSISNIESAILLEIFGEQGFDKKYFVLSKDHVLCLSGTVQRQINNQSRPNQPRLGCPVMKGGFGKSILNLLQGHLSEI